MENYYDILEIAPNASEKVIRSAYKALVKKYHPDVYKGDKEYAHQQMLKINEAYEVLSDAEKRRMYDSHSSEETAREGEQEQYCSDDGSSHMHDSEQSKHSGCLSCLFKIVITLCVLGAIIYICTRLFSGGLKAVSSFLSENRGEHLETAESQGTSVPLDNLHDEAVTELLCEAATITDDEERLVQFSTALGMETIELGFKVNAYLHYGGENPEDKAFYKEQMQLIEETTDLMRQYHSNEEVEAVWALMVTDYYLNFDESCFDYDYRFGTEWNKKNIDVDALWEMYLSSLTEWADQQPET